MRFRWALGLMMGTALASAGAVAQTAAPDTLAAKAATPAPTAGTEPAQTAQQLHDSAVTFMERLNYARVAVALENAPLAKQHVTEAQRLLKVIRTSNPAQLRMADVGAGQVTYQNDTGRYYYPLNAGPVEVEATKQAPLNKKSLAVSDAQMAYVTLDFTTDDADKLLAKALQNIDGNDLKAAQGNLGELIGKVVDTKGQTVAVPLVQARDNMALARSFIAMKNYSGARFALKHADRALDMMEQDPRYASHQAAVKTLRQDFTALQTAVQQDSPGAWSAADAKLQQWWSDLKNWAND